RGLQLEPFTGRIRGKATLYMRVPEERDRGTRTLKLTFSIFSGEQIFILIEQRAMHATHVRSFGRNWAGRHFLQPFESVGTKLAARPLHGTKCDRIEVFRSRQAGTGAVMISPNKHGADVT